MHSTMCLKDIDLLISSQTHIQTSSSLAVLSMSLVPADLQGAGKLRPECGAHRHQPGHC